MAYQDATPGTTLTGPIQIVAPEEGGDDGFLDLPEAPDFPEHNDIVDEAVKNTLDRVWDILAALLQRIR